MTSTPNTPSASDLTSDIAFRIGYGEDAHRLVKGKPLIIGNIAIESDFGCEAHSDGDVLLHALSDALLSTFALGDIGTYFPPSNQSYKDADSAELLLKLFDMLNHTIDNFTIINLAIVITLDQPKLGQYRSAMQERLAELIRIDAKNIGITFKTSEGLALNHIQARVSVLASGTIHADTNLDTALAFVHK